MKVIKFFATWCGPCQAQKAEFEKNTINAKAVISLDVDDAENIRFVNGFGVKKLPTTILTTDEFDSSVWGDDKNDYKKIEVKRWPAFVSANDVNAAIAEYEANNPQNED